jgi:hypothetical protein
MRAPQDRQKCDSVILMAAISQRAGGCKTGAHFCWPRFGKKSGAVWRPINVRASRRDYIFL